MQCYQILAHQKYINQTSCELSKYHENLYLYIKCVKATRSIVLVMNRSAMELYTSLLIAAISHTCAKGINDVINAVHCNKLVILCDQTYEYCPGEKLLSTRPSSYHILDLQNRSLLVTRFEEIYKLSQMNWLVFCSNCVPLLSVINEFESSHQLQGYFTHMYQWILVTNSTQTK